MLVASIPLAGLLLTLVVAGWMYRSQNHLRKLERLERSFFIFCAYAALVVVASGVYSAPVGQWNEARLAPLLGWLAGNGLYSTVAAGSIQTTMYPPLSALAYAPAVVAHSPAYAVFIGSLLAHIYFLAPLGLACYRPSVGRGLAPFVVFFLVFWSRQSVALLGSQSVHADAPALGFGLVACLAAFHYTKSNDVRGLAAAVLMAWLSVWSKQTMVLLFPALAAWVLCVRGVRRCAVFVGWSFLAGMVIAVIMGLTFSVEGMWFNMFVIPANVEWTGRIPFNLVGALTELLREAIVPLGVLIGGVTYKLLSADAPLNWRDWARGQPWLLPALIGFFNVPVSVVSRVKLGGGENCLSFSLYFWIAAMGLFVLYEYDALRRLGQSLLASRYRTIVAALTVWLALLSLPQSLRAFVTVLPPWSNESQVTYNSIRQSPGRYYFPDYPLAHLLAEGRLYHYAAAVRDRRDWGGIPISQSQLQSHFPSEFDVLCVDSVRATDTLMRIRDKYFTEYSKQTGDLPQSVFHCYARPAN
jgi:hypothetical protein